MWTVQFLFPHERPEFALLLLLIAFAAGLAAGLPSGHCRLRALKKALPQVEGRFFITDVGVLNQTPEGQRARNLEFGAYALVGLPLLAFLSFATLGRLRASSYAMLLAVSIPASYIPGVYLTSSGVPYARVWLWLRKRPPKEPAEVGPPVAVESEGLAGGLELPPGRKVRLIWAFNPILQISWGAVVTAVIGAAAFGVSADGRFDRDFLPVAFVLGLLLGHRYVADKRWHVLRQNLLALNGRFFFTQWGVMESTPEGAAAMKLQGLSVAMAVLAMMGPPSLTQDRRFWIGGSGLAFALGVFLTGKIWPFVRLWLALKKNRSTGTD